MDMKDVKFGNNDILNAYRIMRLEQSEKIINSEQRKIEKLKNNTDNELVGDMVLQAGIKVSAVVLPLVAKKIISGRVL